MEFKDVISVPGMSGLFKIIGNNKSGFIVESLADGKRTMISSSQRIMTLPDIAVFTTGEDKPLRDVFKDLQEKHGNKVDADLKGDQAKLRSYFKTIVPDFDEERVYTSDIKKILSWFELLKDKIDFTKKEEPVQEDHDKKSSVNEEKPVPKIHEAHGPKAAAAKVTQTKTRKKV